MPNFAIFRQRKLRSSFAIAAASAHNLRLRKFDETVKWPEFTAKNVVFGKNPLGEFKTKTIGQKIRKNAIYAVELFMGFSPEMAGHVHEGQFGKVCEEWVDRVFPGMRVQIALHRDEATPHLHCILIPLTKDGQLNYKHAPVELGDGKEWKMGGKFTFNALQTSFAKEVERFGLTRGIEGSRAEHVPPRDFKIRQENAIAQMDNYPRAGLINSPATAKKINQTLDGMRLNVARHFEGHRDAEKENVRLLREKKAHLAALDAAKAAQKLADARLRDIDLTTVMQLLGYEMTRKEGEEMVFDTQLGKVSINEKKHLYSVDWGAKRGGSSAISLAMDVGSLDFQAARSLLAEISPSAATAASVVHCEEQWNNNPIPALTFDQKLERYASPSPDKLNIVRNYLIDVRKLASKLVEQLIQSGKIWANKMGSVVFGKYNSRGELKGVSIRGTSGQFKQVIGSKKEAFFSVGDIHSSPTVAICESPIEAIAYHGRFGIPALSTDGNGDKNSVIEFLLSKQIPKSIHLALNNDPAGAKMTQELHLAIRDKAWSAPEYHGMLASEHIPGTFKDWAEYNAKTPIAPPDVPKPAMSSTIEPKRPAKPDIDRSGGGPQR